jgi:hypothetical protein
VGHHPPQSVSLLRPAPTLSPFFQLAHAIIKPNLFPYKYPNNLIPIILPTRTTYEDGTDSVPKRRHIKFTCQGITQKKEYINYVFYMITTQLQVFFNALNIN